MDLRSGSGSGSGKGDGWMMDGMHVLLVFSGGCESVCVWRERVGMYVGEEG